MVFTKEQQAEYYRRKKAEGKPPNKGGATQAPRRFLSMKPEQWGLLDSLAEEHNAAWADVIRASFRVLGSQPSRAFRKALAAELNREK